MAQYGKRVSIKKSDGLKTNSTISSCTQTDDCCQVNEIETIVHQRLASFEKLVIERLDKHERQLEQLQTKITLLEGQMMKQECSSTASKEVVTEPKNSETSERTIQSVPKIEKSSVKSVINDSSPVDRNATNRSDRYTSNAGPSMGGGYVFRKWMTSGENKASIWFNQGCRNNMVNYLSKIFNYDRDRIQWQHLYDEDNHSLDELDFLRNMVENIRKQQSCQRSLEEWEFHSRPDKRAKEVKFILEYGHNEVQSKSDLCVSPDGLKEIIPSGSIKTYFDLLCREAINTADIGKHLALSKTNILGGNDYDPCNADVTFIKVDLKLSKIHLEDEKVDLITCLVTLHHIPDLKKMLLELKRILRPKGYLIIREHDCENTRNLTAKFLNFIHATMMIAGVGEFAQTKNDSSGLRLCSNDPNKREAEKSEILNELRSIQYRTRSQWQNELQSVGFRHIASVDYPNHNPQKLYTEVFQLHNK